VVKGGYVYRVDVPRRSQGGIDLSEQKYHAYAWPVDGGSTGVRVFVIDGDGTVFFSDNRGESQSYRGTERVPGSDACELRDAGDRVTGVTAVRRGRDGGIWLEYE
jgi:hypothetical protein